MPVLKHLASARSAFAGSKLHALERAWGGLGLPRRIQMPGSWLVLGRVAGSKIPEHSVGRARTVVSGVGFSGFAFVVARSRGAVFTPQHMHN
eukprot:6260706-Pyramimonas_sp.AAC.1